MTADPPLDHLEKTFADSYRKEIDQEENVWRGLPFFAATLALELAALTQVRALVGGVSGPMLLAATGFLAVAGGSTLVALTCLCASVWPANHRRVAHEPKFLDYAKSVRAQARAGIARPGLTDEDASEVALLTVKEVLTDDYAAAVDETGERMEDEACGRTRAGLATLTSVLSVLLLVGLAVLASLYGHD